MNKTGQERSALVFSAGGMYGAYQAGAWSVLADVFKPDLIVGASIGAVNGWAVAGGCEPDELVERWRHLNAAAGYRWKTPRSPFGGILNSELLTRAIREIHETYRPRMEFALVLTDLLKLRPEVFRAEEVTWQHLVATTALVGIFDQVRIGGRLYSDGGLLSAVPLWVAAQLGATRALVINVLPSAPGLVAKVFVQTMRWISPFQAPDTPAIEVLYLAPPALLGTPRESLYWKRENADKWIEQGKREAAAIKHSIPNCFERK